MATIQQIEQALVTADKAGDADAARKLAAFLARAKLDPQNQIAGEEVVEPPQEAEAFEILSIPEEALTQAVGAGDAVLAATTGSIGGAAGMIGGTLKGIASEIVSAVAGQQSTQKERAERIKQEAEKGMQIGAQATSLGPYTEAGANQLQALGEFAESLPAFIPAAGQAGAITSGLTQAMPAVAPALRATLRRGGPEIPEIDAQPLAQGAAEITPEDALGVKVGELTKKASTGRLGVPAAKEELARIAQINMEDRAAAQRIGIELPEDVFSDNPQFKSAVGTTRSISGSEAEAEFSQVERNAIHQADRVLQELDAAFVEGRPSPGDVSQRVLDSVTETRGKIEADAKAIYEQVGEVVPKTSVTEFPALTKALNEMREELTENGLPREAKTLLEMATDSKATYGRLLYEKDSIGKALDGQKSPYGNLTTGYLKRLYGALAEDQLAHVEKIGGADMRSQLRAANRLTETRKALEKRIVRAYGREMDGSIATMMRSAIKGSASSGDTAQFTKLMKVVPKELRKETIATAISAATSTGKAAQEGSFDFAAYSKMYPGLIANPKVYSQIVDALGPGSHETLRSLYVVSRRITEARANVLTTGKANQAVLSGLNADNLIGKVMNTAAGATAYAGASKVAGPVAAFSISNAVKSFLHITPQDRLAAAGKLFSSKEFQELLVDASTKEKPSKQAVQRVAASKAFTEFARSVNLDMSIAERVEWIEAALLPLSQIQQSLEQEEDR